MNYDLIIKSIAAVREKLSRIDPVEKRRNVVSFFVCIELEHVLSKKFRLSDFELEHAASLIREEAQIFARQFYPDTFDLSGWDGHGMIDLAPEHVQKDGVTHAIWLKEHRLKLLDRLAERFK